MAYKVVAESNGDDIGELMGYDKWPRDVAIAFERERGAVVVKYLKIHRHETTVFAQVIADFRTLEEAYVERLRDNLENVQQVRRIITERLLQMAIDLDEPFEVCERFWNELQQVGFYRIERQINNTWTFADTCFDHGQMDRGLEVIAPVIAELERLRAKTNLNQWAMEYYDQEIESFAKLRARLEEARNALPQS